MNRHLDASLNRLIRSFESARESERQVEPFLSWKTALACVDAASTSLGARQRLLHLRACLVSLEGVLRCWRDCGFQESFRVAAALLEQARVQASSSAEATAIRAA